MKFLFPCIVIVLCSSLTAFAASVPSLGLKFIMEFVAQRKPYTDLPLEALAETMEKHDNENEMFSAHVKYVAKMVASGAITPKNGYDSLVPSIVAFCKTIRNKDGKKNETSAQLDLCIRRNFTNLGTTEQIIQAAQSATIGHWSENPSKSAFSQYRELVTEALKETCSPKRAFKTYLRSLILLEEHVLVPKKLDWNNSDRAMERAYDAFDGIVKKTVDQADADSILGKVTPIVKAFIKNVNEEREYFEDFKRKSKDIDNVDDVEKVMNPSFFDKARDFLYK